MRLLGLPYNGIGDTLRQLYGGRGDIIRYLCFNRAIAYVLVFIVLFVPTVSVMKVHAASITVDKSADGDTNGSCSLADAIAAANTDTATNGCTAGSGADTITLGVNITLDDWLPDITSDITIEGADYDIDGNGEYQIFYVDGGDLTINNITLTGGVSGSYGGAINADDGSSLTVTNSRLEDNEAGLLGGAIATSNTNVIIRDSVFVGNTSGSLGGALAFFSSVPTDVGWTDDMEIKTLLIDQTTFGEDVPAGCAAADISADPENHADASGGALRLSGGDVTIRRSSFIGNKAGVDGGAIYASAWRFLFENNTVSCNRADADGGGMYIIVGDLILRHSTVYQNSAGDEGGGLYTVDDTGRDQDNEEEGLGLYLQNTIIAGSTSGGDCVVKDTIDHNIGMYVGDGSCEPVCSSTDGPINLGELQGEPAYHPLLDGSVAINRADVAVCSLPESTDTVESQQVQDFSDMNICEELDPEQDQIGTNRPMYGNCDIGAIESRTGVDYETIADTDPPTDTPVPAPPDTDVPPATDTDVPPATDTDVPPATDTDVPPATDTDVPPATDTDVPPATDTDVPPATDTDVPPPTDTDVPPATDTDVPPATDTDVPPPTDTDVPPPTDTAVPDPPAQDPPATDTAIPPATDTAIPPATDTAVPPVEDPSVEDPPVQDPPATDTAVPDPPVQDPLATETTGPPPTDTDVAPPTETALPLATRTSTATATATLSPEILALCQNLAAIATQAAGNLPSSDVNLQANATQAAQDLLDQCPLTQATATQAAIDLTATAIALNPEIQSPSDDPTANQCVYKVVAGDTLFRLSLSYNTTVNEFKYLNQLSSDLLFIGQDLFVPGCYYEPELEDFDDTDLLYLCQDLFGSVVVRSTNNDLKCRPIDTGNIDKHPLLATGMLDAVEIRGYVDKGVEICFRSVGELVFLDPVTSPPRPLKMSVQYNDLGMTCGQVDRIGTVVLVSIATEEDTLILLSDCLVTTTQTLRLRDGAGGASVLGLVPYYVTLQTDSRTENWFSVNFLGTDGWISAKYVETDGICE